MDMPTARVYARDEAPFGDSPMTGQDECGYFLRDPVIEAYKKDVDRTLLRENLKLTVEQRIENLQCLLNAAEELRRAGRNLRRKS